MSFQPQHSGQLRFLGSLVCRLCRIDVDHAIDDLDGYRLQRLADTGTGNAQTAIGFKQRVVRGALDISVVHVEETVFLPLKIDAGMRTTVDEGSNNIVTVHHEQRQLIATVLDFETT